MTTDNTKSRVLLIGGGGYIGTVVTEAMLASGRPVTNLDCALYDHAPAAAAFVAHPLYRVVAGDFRADAALDRALEGVSHVVILAGLVGDPITKAYPDLSDTVNRDGCARLVERLHGRGLDRVIFVSTCSNYGLIPEDDLADETYPLRPLSLYAQAKVATEAALIEAADRLDFTATVLRFATAFGLSPRMRFDLTLNEFARTLAVGEELQVYDADTWRPYCHVTDFARLTETVLTAPADAVSGEVFNAGGDANNYTKRMMVEEVLRHVPDGRVAYVESGGDPRNYRVDFSKVESRLGFRAAVGVPDGVAEIVAAVRRGHFADLSPRTYYGNYAIDTDRFAE
jgi:nucleoside-diphosphate-sugar epimerase